MTTLAYTLSDSRSCCAATSSTSSATVDDSDAGRHAYRAPPAIVYVFAASSALDSARTRVVAPTSTTSFRAPSGHVAAAVQGTSIMSAMDMTGGIIDRFGPWPSPAHRPHRSRARQPDPNPRRHGHPHRVAFGLDSAPQSGLSRGWLRSGCWRCSRSR